MMASVPFADLWEDPYMSTVLEEMALQSLYVAHKHIVAHPEVYQGFRRWMDSFGIIPPLPEDEGDAFLSYQERMHVGYSLKSACGVEGLQGEESLVRAASIHRLCSFLFCAFLSFLEVSRRIAPRRQRDFFGLVFGPDRTGDVLQIKLDVPASLKILPEMELEVCVFACVCVCVFVVVLRSFLCRVVLSSPCSWASCREKRTHFLVHFLCLCV